MFYELHPSNSIQGAGSKKILDAYFVLIFAHLESYVKEIVEDAIDALNQHVPAPSNWPKGMLGYVVHHTLGLHQKYKDFAFHEDENVVISSVGEVADRLLRPNTQNSFQVDATAILDKKKYPSPKNMPQLFRRIGISDLFGLVSADGGFNSKITLTSLNDIRSVIAHSGGVSNGFLVKEFKDYVKKMVKFVVSLDRVISGHFKTLLSSKDFNRIVC